MAKSTSSVIRSVKRLARKVLPGDAKLVLFGSRARGDARPDSDWDMMILLNQDKIGADDFDRYAYPFVKYGWQQGEYFSMKLFTQKDWESHSWHPFFKNIAQDGITL